MHKGADVFRNVGCDGKTDFVISYKQHLFKIDVKIFSGNYLRGTPVPPDVYPVVVVAVDPSNVSTWHVRWRGLRKGVNITTSAFKANCPPGLENFWD